jgi:predicted small secreted protein
MKRLLSAITIVASALSGCNPIGGFGDSTQSHVGTDYVIRPGDTLYGIAAREYGDPLEWLTIYESNPWIDPEALVPGDKIFIPPSEGRNLFNVDPQDVGFEDTSPALSRTANRGSPDRLRSGNPGGGSATKKTGLGSIFQNIGGQQIFGEPIEKLGAAAFGGFLVHGFLQGFLLWIVATVSFVKDVTFKKSLKAAFHTETLTVFSVLIIGGIALLMLHIGTSGPGAAPDSASLARSMEQYLRNPTGLMVVGFVAVMLYLLLWLRFVPPALGLKRAQSMMILALAVIAPHVFALYTIGQRMGWIKI